MQKKFTIAFDGLLVSSHSNTNLLIKFIKELFRMDSDSAHSEIQSIIPAKSQTTLDKWHCISFARWNDSSWTQKDWEKYHLPTKRISFDTKNCSTSVCMYTHIYTQSLSRKYPAILNISKLVMQPLCHLAINQWGSYLSQDRNTIILAKARGK